MGTGEEIEGHRRTRDKRWEHVLTNEEVRRDNADWQGAAECMSLCLSCSLGSLATGLLQVWGSRLGDLKGSGGLRGSRLGSRGCL